MDVLIASASTGTYLPGNNTLPVHFFLKNIGWDFYPRLYLARGNHHIIPSRKTYEIYMRSGRITRNLERTWSQINGITNMGRYTVEEGGEGRGGSCSGERSKGSTNEQGDGKPRIDL